MTKKQLIHYLRSRFESISNRYPTPVRWLASRLTTDEFSGLPLTVLLGLLIVNVVVLSEIAENVVQAELMVQIDHLFTQMLFLGRSAKISAVLYVITWFGSFQATIGFVLLGTAVLLWQRRWWQAILLWLLVGGVGLFVQVGKRIFVRDRPSEVAYYPEVGYSFPSGHSATAMLLYGLLAYWLIRRVGGLRTKILIVMIAGFLILAVGFSRIYLGVHFLSDVLGGYLLGMSWLILGIVLTEWKRTGHQSGKA